MWTLLILIGLAWGSYPIAGAARCAPGHGFSFLPELLIFPAVFFGVARLIDDFAMPWGRCTVGGVCLAMLVIHLSIIIRYLRRSGPGGNIAA